MKKILASVLSIVLVASLLLAFTGCNGGGTDTGTSTAAPDVTNIDVMQGLTIVAEKESAGESVAMTDTAFKNATYVAVDAQSKALTEVAAGTADGCVVDYVCSIGMIGEGTDFAGLSVVDKYAFADEQYGIAFRKGSTKTVALVNDAINQLVANGKLLEIATKYKLQDQIITTPIEIPEDSTLDAADWDYIKAKGELVIGITLFAPMNYKDDTDTLTGFETEFATAVCEILGVTPKFQEISWTAKETELSGKNIDCIWNGMTITDERLETMQISAPYMANKQVLVVKSENVDKF